MFNKIRAVFKKNQPRPLQLSEEDRKKELDKQLLNLIDSRQLQHDPIPDIIKNAQSLLANGANINARGDKQTTVLHEAVENDQLELVKFFISQGSDVNAINGFKQTPLFRVKSKAVTQELLKEGADIDVIDNDKHTPLVGALYLQGCRFTGKKYSPNSIYSEPPVYREANETLAKAYLTKYPNLERPNCPEEIVSKNDWEVWKEQIIKKCDVLSAPLETLHSLSKATPTNDSIKEDRDLLEKEIQCLQIQQEGGKKANRLLTSHFFTQHQTAEENKLTKSEVKVKLTG